MEIRMLRLLLTAIALFVLGACAASPPPAPMAAAAEQRAPVTILLSIDAFRPDYLGKGNTPNLDALATTGVKATMRPAYPVLTFPNHYTLVTGLRPDRHGIVANIFYDPRRPDVRFFSKEPEAADPFWWAEAEPIWITAERNGIRAGTMFWPGEEVAYDGSRPSDWARYDPNFTEAQRVMTVIDWMRRPAEIRPRFVTLYFDLVDKTAHKQGPWGAPTIKAIREADALVGSLRDQLAALGQPANLVIVSDHGMRAVAPERTVRPDAILPPDSYRLVSYGPFATIDAKPGKDEIVARVLLAPHPHMDCWRKADVPARLRYGANPRVGSFVCQAKAGGEVMNGIPTNKGDHGYDPDDPDMTGLFLVNGPGFRAGARVPAIFDNVDLYPMLARLIGVPARPNDGDAETLRPILRTDSN
jgi:predicted AlkP superfamily pyrophosphatase or phosphodiesterase